MVPILLGCRSRRGRHPPRWVRFPRRRRRSRGRRSSVKCLPSTQGARSSSASPLVYAWGQLGASGLTHTKFVILPQVGWHPTPGSVEDRTSAYTRGGTSARGSGGRGGESLPSPASWVGMRISLAREEKGNLNGARPGHCEVIQEPSREATPELERRSTRPL